MAYRRGLLIIAAFVILAMLLTACQGTPAREPTPAAVQTPVARTGARASSVVSASGTIVPIRMAELGFAVYGQIAMLEVNEGVEVTKGTLLVGLEAEQLLVQVQQAEAALAGAQAGLAALEEGPRAERVAAAQAAVATAETQVRIVRAQVESAKAAVQAASGQVELARAALADLRAGPTASEVAMARTAIKLAENELWGAQAVRDGVGGAVDRGAAGSYEQDRAEAGVGMAYESLQMARLELQRLQAGPRAGALAQALEQVRIAEASQEQAEAQVRVLEEQLRAAQAGVQQAQAEAALATLGPTEAQRAGARAALAQAEAGLAASQAAVRALELRAPFDGTVVDIDAHPGEAVLPAETLVVLADVSQLQVETTDLSERDVIDVAPGQAVTIHVDALSGDLAGRVVEIAPRSDQVGGDVVYRVVISLDEQPQGLRWGMSVDVDIETTG